MIRSECGSAEERIGRLLLDRKRTLAVAESCTGGLIGQTITSVAGSSRYFLGGVICYSNRIKVNQLGVDPGVLAEDGAVSERVVRQMADGIRVLTGADIGVAVTGIAGPGGGSVDKPVGLVYVGVHDGRECEARRFEFRGDRDEVRRAACGAALEMVADILQ